MWVFITFVLVYSTVFYLLLLIVCVSHVRQSLFVTFTDTYDIIGLYWSTGCTACTERWIGEINFVAQDKTIILDCVRNNPVFGIFLRTLLPRKGQCCVAAYVALCIHQVPKHNRFPTATKKIQSNLEIQIWLSVGDWSVRIREISGTLDHCRKYDSIIRSWKVPRDFFLSKSYFPVCRTRLIMFTVTAKYVCVHARYTKVW